MPERGIARIFVRHDRSVFIQSLENHLENVRFLASVLEELQNIPSEFHEELLKACRLHDWGKRATFRLVIDEKAPFGFTYSFRGHPYVTLPGDSPPLVEALVRGHHDYSVKGIVRAAGSLSDGKIRRHYARLLYLLELADQIEAEAANWAIVGQATPRTFMDVVLERINEQQASTEPAIHVRPWPFIRDEIEIQLEGVEWNLPEWVPEKFTSENKAELKRLEEELQDAFQKASFTTHSYSLRAPEHKIRPKQPDAFSIDDTYRLLGGPDFIPQPWQREVYNRLIQDDPPGFLILAPTGSGKTEAVLFPSFAKGRRVILVLPARSLVEDQLIRAHRYLQAWSRQVGRAELIVDTGAVQHHWVYVNGGEPSTPRHQYDRHFYHADLILTTLDKFIYRFFGYGAENKAYIYPRRIGEERTLIVFDEAHSYEKVAWTNFLRLVETLYTRGVGLVVMTATLPTERARYLNFLETLDFLSPERAGMVERKSGAKNLSYLPEPEQETVQKVINQVIERYRPGLKAIVVLERVETAVEVYRILKGNPQYVCLLYHGRMPDERRKAIYEKLKRLDNQEDGPGYLLVTTSAIEVGCDLDAQLLITQATLPERIIQRDGRCNRRGRYPDAQIIVVGDAPPAFLFHELGEERKQDWLKAQEELQRQHGGIFNPEPLLRTLTGVPLFDYRVEMLFDLLYDYVYKFDPMNAYLHDQGFIVTRSWEPTVVVTTKPLHPGSKVSSHDLDEAITLPITYLIDRKWSQSGSKGKRQLTPEQEEKVQRCREYLILEKFFRSAEDDDQGAGWYWDHLKSGSLYFKEVVIVLPPGAPEAEGFDELGLVHPPPLFYRWRQRGQGYRYMLRPIADEGNQKDQKRKLWYNEGISFARDVEETEAVEDQGPIIV